MTPTSPNSFSTNTKSTFNDQRDVGVVVVVGTSGDFDVLVSKVDELGVGLEVFGGGHGAKAQQLSAEHLVAPFPHGSDGLESAQTVVGDQDRGDGASASQFFDEIADPSKGRDGMLDIKSIRMRRRRRRSAHLMFERTICLEIDPTFSLSLSSFFLSFFLLKFSPCLMKKERKKNKTKKKGGSKISKSFSQKKREEK